MTRTVVLTGIGIALVAIFGFTFLWPDGTDDGTRVVLQDGRKFNNEQVKYLLARFAENGIAGAKNRNGKISVPKSVRDRCVEVIESDDFRELGRQPVQGTSIIPRSLMTPTEQTRLATAEKIEKLKAILSQLSGIRKAEVVYDMQKSSNFKRNVTQTALVTLWAEDGALVEIRHAMTARKMIQNSFAGMDSQDVLVVDGNTGTTFPDNKGDQPQLSLLMQQAELEATRQAVLRQCKSMLAEYRIENIEVNMELRKQTIQVQDKQKVAKQTIRNVSMTPKMEAITNGVGRIDQAAKIGSSEKKDSAVDQEQDAPAENRLIFVKRLLGIRVLLTHQSINEYVRKNVGAKGEISKDQFQRGVTSIRNDITQKIAGWVRSRGLDYTSDIVSVELEDFDDSVTLSETAHVSMKPDNIDRYFLAGVASLILVFGALLIWQKKSSGRSDGNDEGQQTKSRRSMISQQLPGNPTGNGFPVN